MAPFDGSDRKPDGLGMAPRVREPESAMIPGMAAPAPAPIRAPRKRFGLFGHVQLGSMPDTSGPGPVATETPNGWTYDFDPVSGNARAAFSGVAAFSGSITLNGGSVVVGGVTSFNTRTGAVVLTLADVTGVGGAPINAPTFTGIPAAPTAAPATNTTQLATTAFVTAAIAAAPTVAVAGVQAFAAAGSFATTQTKVAMSAPTVNAGAFWDAGNNRWTPPAGTYHLTVAAAIASTGASVGLVATLRKNGVTVASAGESAGGAGAAMSVVVSCVVTANGTDFFELWANSAPAQAMDTTGTYIAAFGWTGS